MQGGALSLVAREASRLGSTGQSLIIPVVMKKPFREEFVLALGSQCRRQVGGGGGLGQSPC